MHNMKAWEKGSGELVVKRKSRKVENSVKEYVPCNNCYGYYHKKDLWRHKCIANTETNSTQHSSKSRVISGRLLLPSSPGKRRGNSKDEQLAREILLHLKNDEIGVVVKHDPLIFELALRESRKNGFDRDRHPYIRNKLREIGRLILALRKLSGERNGRLSDFIKPNHFTTIVNATHEVTCHTPESVDIPSLALKLGHTLKRCALLKKASAIEHRDVQARCDCDEFITLYELKWNESVSSQATRTL